MNPRPARAIILVMLAASALASGCSDPGTTPDFGPDPTPEPEAQCVFTLFLTSQGWEASPPSAPVEHAWPINPLVVGGDLVVPLGDLVLPVLDEVPAMTEPTIMGHVSIMADNGSTALFPPRFGEIYAREIRLPFQFPPDLQAGEVYYDQREAEQVSERRIPTDTLSWSASYPAAPGLPLKMISEPPDEGAPLPDGTTRLEFHHC